MFTAAYGVSIGPIGWVLPSEVFPLSMRSKGVALSTASNWLNNSCFFFPFLIVFFFYISSLHRSLNTSLHSFLRIVSIIHFPKKINLTLPLLTTYLPPPFFPPQNKHNSATFIIFSSACGLAYFWATYIVPETANVSLEEIDSLFTSSVGREDAAVKEQVTIRYTISFSSLFRRPLLYSFSFFLLSYFLQLFLIGELMLRFL